MSFIHLLFPPGELELPGHAWHEATLSKRTLSSEESQLGWRNLEPLSKRRYTGHNHQRSLYGYPEHIATWRTKHLHSKTQSRALREHGPAIKRLNCPNYRGPTVPHNRGHRYSISPSYWPEAQTQGSTPHSVGESTSFPSMINVSTPSSPDDSVDIPSTPGSVCDQFRSGPFGHIFEGQRLTGQEREFLEELAQPDAAESQGQKQRAPTAAEIVQTLSQTTYSDFINQNSSPGGDTGGQITDDRSSIAAKPAGDDDEGAEREKGKSTHETEPLIIHKRTVPGADDTISERDKSLALAEVLRQSWDRYIKKIVC